MSTTPTPRDLANGKVDVTAIGQLTSVEHEPGQDFTDLGRVYVAGQDVPLQPLNGTLTVHGRRYLATMGRIEAAPVSDEVKAEATRIAGEALAAATVEVDPANLTKYHDGAVIYYETTTEPISRNVMVRDRGAWWVAGSDVPVCDVDLTPEYVETIRDGATLWLVRA